MSKGINKGTVWKHCKSNTLWVITHRGDDWAALEGIGSDNNGERRSVGIDNILKKYKFDDTYRLLKGKYKFDSREEF